VFSKERIEMASSVASRMDQRIGSCSVFIHQNSIFNFEASSLSEPCFRNCADPRDNQVRWNLGAIRQKQTVGMAAIHTRSQSNINPFALMVSQNNIASRRTSQSGEKPIVGLQNGHFAASSGRARCDFQSNKAAPNHRNGWPAAQFTLDQSALFQGAQ
jgi:hypothetical protein